jgi:hypothetical protein
MKSRKPWKEICRIHLSVTLNVSQFFHQLELMVYFNHPGNEHVLAVRPIPETILIACFYFRISKNAIDLY